MDTVRVAKADLMKLCVTDAIAQNIIVAEELSTIHALFELSKNKNQNKNKNLSEEEEEEEVSHVSSTTGG